MLYSNFSFPVKLLSGTTSDKFRRCKQKIVSSFKKIQHTSDRRRHTHTLFFLSPFLLSTESCDRRRVDIDSTTHRRVSKLRSVFSRCTLSQKHFQGAHLYMFLINMNSTLFGKRLFSMWDTITFIPIFGENRNILLPLCVKLWWKGTNSSLCLSFLGSSIRTDREKEEQRAPINRRSWTVILSIVNLTFNTGSHLQRPGFYSRKSDLLINELIRVYCEGCSCILNVNDSYTHAYSISSYIWLIEVEIVYMTVCI